MDRCETPAFLREDFNQKILFRGESSSDLDSSRSSFYFVLRSRLQFNHLCRIRDGAVMKESVLGRYTRRYLYVRRCIYPCAQLLHGACIRVCAGRRGRIYRRQQGIRAAILSKRDLSQIRKFVRGCGVYESSTGRENEIRSSRAKRVEGRAKGERQPSVGSNNRKI